MFFPSSDNVESITPEDLERRRAAGDDPLLLDVRTPAEHAAGSIEGSLLIPLHELPQRLDELPRDRQIVAYCRVGNRSAYATLWLRRAGFRVLNLAGGIDRWRASGGALTGKERISAEQRDVRALA